MKFLKAMFCMAILLAGVTAFAESGGGHGGSGKGDSEHSSGSHDSGHSARTMGGTIGGNG